MKNFANDLNDDENEVLQSKRKKRANKRDEMLRLRLRQRLAKGFGFGFSFSFGRAKRQESQRRVGVGVGVGVSCTWPSNKSNNAGQRQHQSDLYCILALHKYIYIVCIYPCVHMQVPSTVSVCVVGLRSAVARLCALMASFTG